MSKRKDKVFGAGTLLRGNYAPRGAGDPKLAAEPSRKSESERRTEAFERAARERIGGSIAFVTRLKDKGKDVLFWEGEEE